MSRSGALETLLELAQTRTDDAAKRLGALYAQGVHLETKLALLLQYRDEYRTRFQVAMRQGLTASDWRNYQEFLDKLDAAVVQQQEALVSAQGRLAAGKLAWQSAKHTFNSYDTLTQRQIQAELLRCAKRDQREADELANNSVARKDTPS